VEGDPQRVPYWDGAKQEIEGFNATNKGVDPPGKYD
jgi:hypothetical protein